MSSSSWRLIADDLMLCAAVASTGCFITRLNARGFKE